MMDLKVHDMLGHVHDDDDQFTEKDCICINFVKIINTLSH